METLDSRHLLTSLADGLSGDFNDDGSVAEVGYVIDVNGQGGYATGAIKLLFAQGGDAKKSRAFAGTPLREAAIVDDPFFFDVPSET